SDVAFVLCPAKDGGPAGRFEKRRFKMMEYQNQLKLQSYLDEELPEDEAREVANWLARDQEAVALLTELRQTRQAVTGFEDGIRLPESREFFWSKIEREIQRQEAHTKEQAPRIPWALRF